MIQGRLCLLLAVVAFGAGPGCGRRKPAGDKPRDAAIVAPPPRDAAPAPPPPDWYRASVGTDLQEVPFFLGVPPMGTAGDCTILNGEEHIVVGCRWNGSALTLEFQVFATTIDATREADGSLTGSWQMSRIAGQTDRPTFRATRVASPDPTLRFPAKVAADPAAPAGDFAGIWKFQFVEFGVGKGTLAQTPDGVVTGTIIPEEIGDMRYMAGNVRGNVLQLSTFDGQHAYVVRAELDASHQAIKGSWTFTGVLSDQFTAQRVPSLDIALVEKLRLKRGAKGVTIPQLDDPSFVGKPVIVDYFGTWCPACMDETPFLVDLYKRHHAAGLEILSIALESTTDDAYNQRQVEVFRKKYAIPWKIVVMPGTYEDSEKLLPPELENTGGYPLTIFLDRDRSVRALHSGFFGPAAGDDYQLLMKTFERHVQEMLAPPAPPGPAAPRAPRAGPPVR